MAEGQVSLNEMFKNEPLIKPAEPAAPVVTPPTGGGDPDPNTPPPDPNNPPAPEGGQAPEGTAPEGTDPEGDETIELTPEEVQAQIDFFNEVNRVRGFDITVDYGNVAPNSIEGIALRERAVEQAAIARYQQELQKVDPRSEAYRMHRLSGGTDEEFFSRKSVTLPDYDVFKENVSLQKQLYKTSLQNRGLAQEDIDVLVESAEKNNRLFMEADRAYREQQDADQKELARLTQKIQEDEQNYRRSVQEMEGLVANTIKSTDLSVVVPDAEQKAFQDFIKENLHIDDKGQFFVAQPINKDTAGQLVSALYLMYKKGDLSKIVARKAQTLVVKQNQIALGQTRKAASSPAPTPAKSKNVPLGNL